LNHHCNFSCGGQRLSRFFGHPIHHLDIAVTVETSFDLGDF
jgi:hypothetical protein